MTFGKLIARAGAGEGASAVLAGRNPQHAEGRWAKGLDLPWRSFDLADQKVDAALKGVSVVLNASRPVLLRHDVRPDRRRVS